ncbi:GmhA Phosphoheptose isomerase [Candidatus Nanopelagicaceae bacterium]
MNNLDRFFTKDSAEFADQYLKYLSLVLASIDREEIKSFTDVLLAARERSSTIFFIGNGGSASTASHFANDIGVGTNSYEKPFRAISLADNQAIITAIGNDFGYEQVFERQLKILGQPGDVLVSISASGNSINLIRAIEFANSNQMVTVSLTAFDGGIMRKISQNSVHVPTEEKEYGPAEDSHMILDHLIANFLLRFLKHD